MILKVLLMVGVIQPLVCKDNRSILMILSLTKESKGNSNHYF